MTALQEKNERLIAKMRTVLRGTVQSANEVLIRSLNADGSPFESTNPNTRHAAAVLLRTAQLQSVGNWFDAQAAKRLDVLEDELLALLRMDDPTDDDDATLERLFASAASRIKYAYADIASETKAELEKLAGILKTGAKADLKATLDVVGPAKPVDVSKLPVLGLTLPEHFKAQADGMALKFKAAVRAGLAAKDTLEGLIERVIGTPTKATANEITDDHFINADVVGGLVVRVRLVDAAQNSFGKFIQSAIQTVANFVSDGVFDGVPPDEKATMGWEWNALHDGHVICPECEALDGQRWTAEFENVDPQGMEWPGFGQRHFGCLCSQVPTDLENASVAKTPLDSIFQAQDRESLDASFGKANTEAFLDGRINGRQLLQQDSFRLSPDALSSLRGNRSVQALLKSIK